MMTLWLVLLTLAVVLEALLLWVVLGHLKTVQARIAQHSARAAAVREGAAALRTKLEAREAAKRAGRS